MRLPKSSLSVDGLRRWASAAGQQAGEIHALHSLLCLDSAEREQGRRVIDIGNQRVDFGARANAARISDQQWNSRRLFIRAIDLIQSLRAKHLSMVRGKYDDRVIRQTAVIEFPQKPADVFVHGGTQPVVSRQVLP